MTTEAASPNPDQKSAPTGRDEVIAAILDSAAQIFAERGPTAASIRDIAAQAGVNHGLVHRHFGSKEQLVAAVLDHQANQLAQLMDAEAPLIIATKGIERGSLALMSEVVSAIMPNNPVAVLTGPNLVGEIVAGHPTASVVAANDPGVADALQRLFSTASFRVYTNPDVIGCEIAGVL